jgi:hypothetical protein
MILAIDIHKYSLDNVFFNEQMKQSINDTNFIRFIYSSKLFSLQGITICFDLLNSSFELLTNQNKKYSRENNEVSIENKYKCTFSIHENNHIIQSIKELEYNLIEQVSLHNYHVNKIPSYKLYEQFKYGEIKLYKLTNINKSTDFISLYERKIIIKISGVWSSNDSFGLTYKLLTSF